MPKRNSSDPYVPYGKKDQISASKFSSAMDFPRNPALDSAPNPLPSRFSPSSKDVDQKVYSYASPNQYSNKPNPEPRLKDDQQIDLRMRKIEEGQLQKFLSQKNPDLPNLPKNDSKKPEPFTDAKHDFQRKEYGSMAKYGIERDKSLQTLRRDLIRNEDLTKLSLDRNRFEKANANSNSYVYDHKASKDPFGLEPFENRLANPEVLRKNQMEKNLLQSDLLKTKPKPFEKFAEAEKFKSPSKFNPIEYEKSMKNFFGVDEDLPPKFANKVKKIDDELPSHSEFKQLESGYSQQVRFAKNNLKSISHDPITGALSSYKVDRPKPRPLGSKPPEVFPGKISDSPPQVEYELPKHTKKAPRNQIFNPLTFETQNIVIERKKFQGLLMPTLNAIEEDPRLTDKIGKSKASELPVSNPPPIYKGMGYKKSSIFT